MPEQTERPSSARRQAETLQLAAAVLGARLEKVEDLGGSARSVVYRARLRTDRQNAGQQNPGHDAGQTPEQGGRSTSVVLKRFLAEPVPPEFHRELAGLTWLDHGPTLLASDPEHGLLVMSDLGDWPTLADLLLGEDPQAAAEGARGWARALGELVGASRPAAAAVAEHLARQQEAENAAMPMSGLLSDGVERMLELVASAAFRRTPALDEELAAIIRLARSAGPDEPTGPYDVVWPGDSCPDNALRTPDGWRFLDLGGTSVNHPALVAAYTVLPFATCWCVYDPPAGFTDELLGAFTTGLRRHVPDAVADPEWQVNVQLAAAAWILMTSGLLVRDACVTRRRIGPEGKPAPTGRQLLATRWRWAARNLSQSAPALAGLCSAATVWAERTWGPDAAPIGPYPAFA